MRVTGGELVERTRQTRRWFALSARNQVHVSSVWCPFEAEHDPGNQRFMKHHAGCGILSEINKVRA